MTTNTLLVEIPEYLHSALLAHLVAQGATEETIAQLQEEVFIRALSFWLNLQPPYGVTQFDRVEG